MQLLSTIKGTAILRQINDWAEAVVLSVCKVFVQPKAAQSSVGSCCVGLS